MRHGHVLGFAPRMGGWRVFKIVPMCGMEMSC